MCFELCLKHNWKAINLHRPQNYFYNNNKCTLLVGYSKWHKRGLRRGGILCLLAQVGGWERYFFLTCNDLPERHWAARDRSQGRVVLWESRTEVSFSIKKKNLCSSCICNPRITIDYTRPGGYGWTLNKITNLVHPLLQWAKRMG